MAYRAVSNVSLPPRVPHPPEGHEEKEEGDARRVCFGMCFALGSYGRVEPCVRAQLD
jgi:hypothetical protein